MKHMILTMLSTLMLLTVYASGVLAGSDEIVIENAWSRASIGIDRPGAAYLNVRNNGAEPLTLIGIETELAMMPQIHRTSTNAEGVSSMAPAGEITISPGETVALEPGGLHAMLMRLTAPMTEGESFMLILLFSDGGDVSVEVPILGLTARGLDD